MTIQLSVYVSVDGKADAFIVFFNKFVEWHQDGSADCIEVTFGSKKMLFISISANHLLQMREFGERCI